MKKATLLAFACALFMGQAAVAQEANEVTYVSDPSQGYMLNRFKDNWFITAEGGAGFYFAHHSIHRNIADRFSPAASLYVGKWFSPVFGGRVGVNYLGLKGLSSIEDAIGVLHDERMIDGKYYKQRMNEFGPVFDVMVNLTNWWCGYRPGRVYNASVYVGAGAYWTVAKSYDSKGQADGWKNAHDNILTIRAGIINSFNISKQVQLSLDIRWSGLDGLQNQAGAGWNQDYCSLQGYLGLTYLFKDREWKAPVVPVCPEPENCDALRARLAAADARIADLEAQLKDCLNRPVEKVVEKANAPLVTVYYPIGVSRLSTENTRVIKAAASEMAQTGKEYVVSGWADNFTGTDAINARLRKNRAEGVKKVLLRNGVAESQLTLVYDDTNNLHEKLGKKCASLDRAVTIKEK